MSYTASQLYGADAIDTLYYLLLAKYGNSSILSSDPTQFKLKVFTTIFEYGPAWLKRAQIQQQLFNLDPSKSADMATISQGNIQFNNHAANPDTAPTTGTFDQLEGINAQHTVGYKRGLLESYEALNDLLVTDVTEEFLGKFKKLFLKVVLPQRPLWYGPVAGDDSTEDVPDINSSLYGNYRTNTLQQIWPTLTSFKTDYAGLGIPRTI